MGRTVKYKIIPTPHFAKDFSKLDEFVKKRVKIYLDYNFLLLWYFLIRKVNNKKGYFIKLTL